MEDASEEVNAWKQKAAKADNERRLSKKNCKCVDHTASALSGAPTGVSVPCTVLLRCVTKKLGLRLRGCAHRLSRYDLVFHASFSDVTVTLGMQSLQLQESLSAQEQQYEARLKKESAAYQQAVNKAACVPLSWRD